MSSDLLESFLFVKLYSFINYFLEILTNLWNKISEMFLYFKLLYLEKETLQLCWFPFHWKIQSGGL